MRSLALFVVLLFFLAAPAPAQTHTVYVTGARTQFTSLDHTGSRAGAGYRADLTPWLAAEAEVTLTRSNSTDPLLFTDGLFRWNQRDHLEASAGVLLTPVRFHGLGLEHGVGLVGGVAVRGRDDQLHRATFRPALFASLSAAETVRTADSLAGAWEAASPGNRAYVLTVGEGTGGAEGGTYVGFTERAQATDFGWRAGVAYEARRGRVTVGTRAVYRRYFGQDGKIGGANALDVSVNVGYRL